MFASSLKRFGATIEEIFLNTRLAAALTTALPGLSVHTLVQGFAGDDFSGVAVSALTLLRHSDKESSSAELGSATPTQIVRRHPRKPAKATIRALF
jgi:hypothetical protein